MVGLQAGRRGPWGTCILQAEGVQEAQAVAQPRGQGEGAAERAAAEEELELGGLARPARAPVAQRHGGLVEVGEQRPRSCAPLRVLLRRHLDRHRDSDLPAPPGHVTPCSPMASTENQEPRGWGYPGNAAVPRQLERAERVCRPHDADGSRFPRMDRAGVGNVSAAPGQPSSSRPRPLARNSSNGCGGQW